MAKDTGIPDPTEAVTALFGTLVKEGATLANEVSDNAKAVARSALGNLDVVSRDEFDAQAAVLQRTRARVEQLEAQIAALLEQVDTLENTQ